MNSDADHTGPRELAPSSTGRGVARSAAVPTIAFYAVVSLLFTAFYFQATLQWSGPDFSACVTGFGPYPLYHDRFQFRVLVPLVARGLSHVIPLDLAWIFKGLTGLSVLGSLLVYREYLSNFLERRFASVFAPVIVYPLLWNYCLLNRIYFPFDLPGVLFFLIGCHLVYQRNWRAYYPVLVLAILNYEGSSLLIFVFWVCLRGVMSGARLRRHIWSQVAILVAVRVALHLALDTDAQATSWFHGTFSYYLPFNAAVLTDMMTLQGNALRDWAKLGLAFGGLWIALPFLLSRTPRFLKMCLYSGVVLVVAVAGMGTIDEVRVYGHLIPVVLTPVLYAVAANLGGVKGRTQAG
ncbi:hypothetical protein KAW64_04885 [bacterium]|nr:hypothetical protein [bacterium]